MYGGLGDAEFFGGGPDCRAVFGNVLREPDGALLDVSPHLHHSRKVVAYYMSRAARLIPDRLSQGSTEVFAKFAKLMAFIQLLFVKMYVILQTTCVIGWEKRQKAQSTAVYQPFFRGAGGIFLRDNGCPRPCSARYHCNSKKMFRKGCIAWTKSIMPCLPPGKSAMWR